MGAIHVKFQTEEPDSPAPLEAGCPAGMSPEDFIDNYKEEGLIVWPRDASLHFRMYCSL